MIYTIIDSDGEPIKARISDSEPMQFHSRQEAEVVRVHGIGKYWPKEAKVIAKHKWSGRQTKALKASIRHWERMRDNSYCGEKPEQNSCACCNFYRKDTYQDDGCGVCPITIFTGLEYCDGTPYMSAWREFYSPNHGHFTREAQKEIDFLNKVLEAGK